jgi:hypothetical protein
MISVKIKEFKNGSLKDYKFNLDEALKKNNNDKINKDESKKDKVIEN